MTEDTLTEGVQVGELRGDFTVRLYADRVDVIGNHTGASGTANHSGGISWLWALIRALQNAGAYPNAASRTASVGETP